MGLQHTSCTVHCADRSFFGIMEQDPVTPGYNVDNITTNLTQFDQTWESLMDSVVNKASKGSSRLKFATGEANFTYFQKIYALMQCTADSLSPTNCDTCLRQSLAYFQSCCHGKQEGYVLRPNCNFNWDLYPFYEIIANAPSPLPRIANSAPPPQFTNTSREKGGIPSFAVVTIVVCTIIFIALVAFTCIFLRRKAQTQIRSKQQTTDAVVEIETVDSLQFNFSSIRVAKSDFSIANELGQGGFGEVDKAVNLPASLNCVGSSYPNHSTVQDVRMHKNAMDSTYLLTIVSYTLMSISLTAGQLQCYNTGNFTTNSTYDQNRNIILSSLASNAVANGGFYNSSIGQEPNRIYALADCSRDSSTEACARCVNATARDIIAEYPNQKEAILWGTLHPLCSVHYANRSFLETLEMDPMLPLVNTGNITSNVTEFDEIWESLMDRIVTKASMGSSRQFATSEENLTSFQKIYAMVQCTPYLSPTNCNNPNS